VLACKWSKPSQKWFKMMHSSTCLHHFCQFSVEILPIPSKIGFFVSLHPTNSFLEKPGKARNNPENPGKARKNPEKPGDFFGIFGFGIFYWCDNWVIFFVSRLLFSHCFPPQVSHNGAVEGLQKPAPEHLWNLQRSYCGAIAELPSSSFVELWWNYYNWNCGGAFHATSSSSVQSVMELQCNPPLLLSVL
jgi:hypothetical protein